MPSDDTRPGALSTPIDPRRRRPPGPSSVLKARLLRLGVFALLYVLVALWFELPPVNWIEDYRHRHDKVVKHRPGFKKVERYSPEHRYRPAASPLITVIGKDGKVKLKGHYHGIP